LPIDRLFRWDANFGLGFPRPPLALLWLIGIVILSAATGVCFALGLTTSTVGFIYLAVISVLSLLDSLISSLVFSVAAVGCLIISSSRRFLLSK
jgi:hypothetical protein